MAEDWDEVLRLFKPPWKVLDRPDGAIRIEDATGQTLVWIYSKQKDTWNRTLPTKEDALVLAKAIARMSKHK